MPVLQLLLRAPRRARLWQASSGHTVSTLCEHVTACDNMRAMCVKAYVSVGDRTICSLEHARPGLPLGCHYSSLASPCSVEALTPPASHACGCAVLIVHAFGQCNMEKTYGARPAVRGQLGNRHEPTHSHRPILNKTHSTSSVRKKALLLGRRRSERCRCTMHTSPARQRQAFGSRCFG